MPTSSGKSPEYDRAVAMLRRGASILDVALATGVTTVAIKCWAKREGIATRVSTPAEKVARADRLTKISAGRRAAYRQDLDADPVRRGRR